jgi:hypothetical protein
MIAHLGETYIDNFAVMRVRRRSQRGSSSQIKTRSAAAASAPWPSDVFTAIVVGPVLALLALGAMSTGTASAVNYLVPVFSIIA